MARTTRLRWAALVAGVALVVAGCSSTGGKQAEESSANAVSAGKADTPKITIAMVTHEPDIAAWTRRIVRFRDGAIESDEANTPVRGAA